MSLKTALLSGAFLAALATGGAQATTVTQLQLTDGASSVNLAGGITVSTSAGGVFGHKTVNTVTGVGVDGPASQVQGEIDNLESITIKAATTQLLSSFQVSFLYEAGAFGDAKNEIALVDAVTGVTTQMLLTVTGAQTATFSGAAGSVANDSIADATGGGEWTVTLAQPVAFSSLIFETGDGGPSPTFGDFAFVQATFAPAVPEPATWAMMILGFMGVGFMAYRRRGNGPSLRLV
jgi:PEP-CTERM motif